MDKKEKKEILKQIREGERKRAFAELPLNRNDFADLFKYLDEALSEACDHTSTKTKAFLDNRNLNRPEVIKWLESNGGYCDCEILNNVEPFCMDIFSIRDADRLTRDDEQR